MSEAQTAGAELQKINDHFDWLMEQMGAFAIADEHMLELVEQERRRQLANARRRALVQRLAAVTPYGRLFP